jgi:hypothetical protein
MLDPQILVDPLLKLAVKVDSVRHGNFLSEGSSQIAWTRPVRSEFLQTHMPVRKQFVFMTQNIVCRHAAAIAHGKDFPILLAR